MAKQRNYLNEKTEGNSDRTRRANFTSADTAVRFRQDDESTRVVLIEWKHTESYCGNSLKTSKSGTDRTAIYQHLWARSDCPICQSAVGQFENLFYEPFYQLMRQQFLADEMELAGEMDADKVSLLHLAPDANADFNSGAGPFH